MLSTAQNEQLGALELNYKHASSLRRAPKASGRVPSPAGGSLALKKKGKPALKVNIIAKLYRTRAREV